MKTKVKWFRHSHENRNDLLRFGLMRLHYSKQINYIELPFSELGKHGFTKTIAEQKDPRHLSFLLIQKGKSKLHCLVDNEDSFALITPLIAEVDVCFCAGFNADFFEKKQFVHPYGWQDETDIEWYRNTIGEKINRLGGHFGKIKRFVPITTNMGYSIINPAWKQKIKNLHQRINRLRGGGEVFSDDYKGFEIRDQALRDLRNHQLEYDIVLNDSLWGWPQHRMNLHSRLQDLHKNGYRVHSSLNWVTPCEIDGGNKKKLDPFIFPITTSRIDDKYEVMLAKSRLAVFACGFHWGWRSVMMLALGTGIPVLTDRLLTEPYFDMNEFKLFQQEDDLWTSIEPTLKSIDEQQWKNWKQHNQAVYDKYMSPEAVANYFLKTL